MAKIIGFDQGEIEYFHKVCERYKFMIKNCPLSNFAYFGASLTLHKRTSKKHDYYWVPQLDIPC